MRRDCQSGPKMLSLFLLIFFLQIGHVYRLVKGIDQLSLMQKILTLFFVPLWKKSGKSVKGVTFHQLGPLGRVGLVVE